MFTNFLDSLTGRFAVVAVEISYSDSQKGEIVVALIVRVFSD